VLQVIQKQHQVSADTLWCIPRTDIYRNGFAADRYYSPWGHSDFPGDYQPLSLSGCRCNQNDPEVHERSGAHRPLSFPGRYPAYRKYLYVRDWDNEGTGCFIHSTFDRTDYDFPNEVARADFMIRSESFCSVGNGIR